MGRHGKNLPLTAPVSRPEFNGVPEIERLLNAYEKQMLADDVRNRMYDQAIESAFAILARILIYHYDDMKNFNERLQVFFGLFNRYHSELDKPNHKQRFSEWLWQVMTGYKLIRSVNEEEERMRDEIKVKMDKQLREFILSKGIVIQSLMGSLNMKQGLLNNCLYGGKCSQPAYDKIIKFVGFEMDNDFKKMYKEFFKNNKTSKEIKAFEDLATEMEDAAERQQAEREIEKKAAETLLKLSEDIEKRQADKSIVEEVSEAPSPISEPVKPIPVPDDLDEVIEEVVVHSDEGEKVETTKEVIFEGDNKPEEDLPFSDCNEMYKECEEKAELSEIDILKARQAEQKKEIDDVKAEITELEERLEILRSREAKRLLKYGLYSEFIQKLEALEE